MSFICFDTETTALPVGSVLPRVCQLGLVKMDYLSLNGKLQGERGWYKKSYLINPEIHDDQWDKDAIEITGIGPDQVKDSPTFFELFEEVAGLFFATSTLIGYNLAFDVRALAGEIERAGFSNHFPWPPTHIDVMPMAGDRLERSSKRGNKSPTLTDAYEAIVGGEMEGAHDGLADAVATARLYVKLTDQ